MARAAAALSVVAFFVLDIGLAADEPGVLLALVGAALCALGCARAPRVITGGGPAVVVPGRLASSRTDGPSRQHHPDSAGRPRPRAPGRALPAI
jgi:hypothetical protein